MAAKQGKLLNTSTMTSTKKMRAMKRQERLDQLPKPVRKRGSDVDKGVVQLIKTDLENTELHLPDESRTFPLLGLKRCWICENAAELIRQHFHGEGMKYRVRCLEFPHCPNETISFNKSTGAVRAWQLAAGLSQA